jgi:hypothetical protein
MEFSNGRLVDATLNLLMLLSREVAIYWPHGTKSSLSSLLSETLSNLMKVVMNLTHDSNDDCKLLEIKSIYFQQLNLLFLSVAVGSKVYGEKPLTWETALVCLLQTSVCLPEDKSFDIMTLVCFKITQSTFLKLMIFFPYQGTGNFDQPGRTLISESRSFDVSRSSSQ